MVSWCISSDEQHAYISMQKWFDEHVCETIWWGILDDDMLTLWWCCIYVWCKPRLLYVDDIAYISTVTYWWCWWYEVMMTKYTLVCEVEAWPWWYKPYDVDGMNLWWHSAIVRWESLCSSSMITLTVTTRLFDEVAR